PEPFRDQAEAVEVEGNSGVAETRQRHPAATRAQTCRFTALNREPEYLTLETHDERSWEVGDGLDRGQETERIELGEPEPRHETGMTSPDRDEERTQESPDAGQLDQEFADERTEDGGPASESEQENAGTGTATARS
ncbi:MAG: hypothetical protein OXF11_04785, partial [Deltaproteobacteria bacterium]|nr:hypothetical protein [Deltaproteobacteria bacterium]